ncbi:Oidioi.mRNA.OKI2018_I69.XSR.g16945.t1.cds [Oikopleura dioica]|uniref:Oidioi.mRNA.OKI2018_I69.XSR.g16945.t1.cds n=1 Tax=Oikopleura dioica TaxID=34765 RepID=A0ABN7SME0_OIKDI|nr:Oidioi.mRNA.OKI2018_I69.XSR.g16945.t1.cds [Oikopleura dioica]
MPSAINPLSSIGSDPLYDAPPATPVYHADDEAAPLSHVSANHGGMNSPTNVSFDSGASSPNSRASSEHRDSICKISSEDLLNFQASAEAQALMLQSLNSLQPQDIQERIQAMGSLFGLDSDPFAINLKHISSLSGLGSGSPVSC